MDISSALFQGEALPRLDAFYAKMQQNWPAAVPEGLKQKLGPRCRHDVVRVVKGIFGLGESPKRWYERFRGELVSLGFRELSVLRCCFVYFVDGVLHGAEQLR